MYPNDDRPDRKKSRGRARPPATTASGDASPAVRPLAQGTSDDPTLANPLSSYPIGMTGEPAAAYPTAGAYAEPPPGPGTLGGQAEPDFVAPGGYVGASYAAPGVSEPAAVYPTTAGYDAQATGYPVAGTYAEPSTAYPAPVAYAEFAASQPTFGSESSFGHASRAERTLELREEQLVARKDLREVGEITVRTVVEEVPGRLEVEAQREEVEIEHVPQGHIVTERVGPYEEDGVLVVPVYEEQLVVVKRLVLKEHLRVRRVSSVEHQLFEDTLRRDRLVIEDPNNTQLVHEQYATLDGDHADHDGGERAEHEDSNPLGQLMRKVLG